MEWVETINEGISPEEIEQLFPWDLSPPRIIEHYNGEVADTYREAGLIMECGVRDFKRVTPIAHMLRWVTYARAQALMRGDALLGPYVDYLGETHPGIGIWQQK